MSLPFESPLSERARLLEAEAMKLPPMKRVGYVVHAKRLDPRPHEDRYADVHVCASSIEEAMGRVAQMPGYRPIEAWPDVAPLVSRRFDRDEDLWSPEEP